MTTKTKKAKVQVLFADTEKLEGVLLPEPGDVMFGLVSVEVFKPTARQMDKMPYLLANIRLNTEHINDMSSMRLLKSKTEGREGYIMHPGYQNKVGDRTYNNNYYKLSESLTKHIVSRVERAIKAWV